MTPERQVAGVTNLPEAELLVNILREEGIPAFQRPAAPTATFYNYGEGPTGVFVDAADYESARAILYGSPLEGAPPPPAEWQPDPGFPRRLLIGAVLAFAIFTLVLLLYGVDH